MISFWENVWKGRQVKNYKKYINLNSNYKFIDISNESVNLTKATLEELNLQFSEFCVCSITDIKYQDGYFDGVVVHAVLDHLIVKEAIKALNELFRITKKNGLIYISFDGLEDDDNEIKHVVLEDGSFKYTDGVRKGMIFKYYTNDEVFKLIQARKIIYFNTKQNGEREVILRKE